MIAITPPKSVLLLVVVALLLAACGSPPVAQTQPAAEATTLPTAAASTQAKLTTATVKVAMLPYFSFAPFYIAQAEGFFAEQGLKVELIDLAQQTDVVPALASGQVDVGSGLISAGILNTIAKGGKIQIVADKGYTPTTGCDSYALIARRGLIQAGIVQHPEQLRGKTANILLTTWTDYYADKALNKVGLKVEDMHLVEVPIPAMLEALNQGQLDLVNQNEPWVTRYIQAGHQAILTPAHELLPDSQSAVTFYGPNLLGKNADVGNRFMVAYLKAVRQYNTGKTDQNIAVLAKAVKLDTATLKQMCWQPLRTDGRINIPSILDFQKWALAKKFMDKATTPAQFWNSSFVDYANAQLGSASK